MVFLFSRPRQEMLFSFGVGPRENLGQDKGIAPYGTTDVGQSPSLLCFSIALPTPTNACLLRYSVLQI